MNDSKRKLFLDVLNGHEVERVPFWFMRQAGRYLPEYRELRAEKGGFLEMVYDPMAATTITMQPIRRFHMDAAILFSDILIVPQALGQKLEFMKGEGPKLEAIRDAEGLKRLSDIKFDEIVNPIYETVSLTKFRLGDEGYDDVALIGFAGSPWTVATYMVEGGGSKDFMDVKTLAYRDPEFFSKLINLLVEATSTYLIGQIKAGAEAIQLFDSWCGVLDETQFKRWVINPTAKIVANIRERYPNIPIIGFPKGAGNYYQDYVSDTNVTAVGIDSQVSPKWAARVLQPLCPVQGNLDPACLLAGGDELVLTLEKILSQLSGGPFIFNLGHGINKETPIENVELMIDTVRNFKI